MLQKNDKEEARYSIPNKRFQISIILAIERGLPFAS